MSEIKYTELVAGIGIQVPKCVDCGIEACAHVCIPAVVRLLKSDKEFIELVKKIINDGE